MTEQEYREKLKEKAKELYCFLVEDPFPVPFFVPRNKEIYSKEFRNKHHLEFWTEVIENLQVIKYG